MGAVLGFILNLLGSSAVGSVLTYLEKRSDNDTERTRIQAVKDQHGMDVQADVVKTGMSHNWFWIPWLIATVPLATWFGYGMVNTMFTSLPHIAEIPDGLLSWAQVAWGNVFYSGAGVAAASLLGNAIRNR